jgi:hypothetical protein
MISSVVSVLGFLLAFTTYTQWLGNKKRDDAYLKAKDYLSAWNEIREILKELTYHYNCLCPSPGKIFEAKETSTKRIEHIYNLQHSLPLAKQKLNQAKSELTFWKVRLRDSFEKKHNSLNDNLSDISVVMMGLNSQLHQYYVEDNKNTTNISSEKQYYDDYVSSAINILDEIMLLGFEDVFNFE